MRVQVAVSGIHVGDLSNDDFPEEANQAAAADLTEAMAAGDLLYPIAGRYALEQIVEAHERPSGPVPPAASSSKSGIHSPAGRTRPGEGGFMSVIELVTITAEADHTQAMLDARAYVRRRIADQVSRQ